MKGPDEAQRGALAVIATGRAGGPIGLLMGTVTAGIEASIARIKFDANGKDSAYNSGPQGSRFDSCREHHFLNSILIALLPQSGMRSYRQRCATGAYGRRPPTMACPA